jgi:hypothetical protein
MTMRLIAEVLELDDVPVAKLLPGGQCLSARDRLLAELDDAAEAAETIRDLEDRLVEAAARWRARLAFATRIRRCSPKRSEL